MTRHRASATFLVLGLVAAVAAPPGRSRPRGRTPTRRASRSSRPSATTRSPPPTGSPSRSTGEQYALSGRVGTKMVHDAAIRTMIALGYPVRDDLTIDTGEVNRVAAPAQAQYGPARRGGAGAWVGRPGLRLPAPPVRPARRPVLRPRTAAGELRPLVRRRWPRAASRSTSPP